MKVQQYSIECGHKILLNSYLMSTVLIHIAVLLGVSGISGICSPGAQFLKNFRTILGFS